MLLQAAALIRLLAWELPYAADAALKKKKINLVTFARQGKLSKMEHKLFVL